MMHDAFFVLVTLMVMMIHDDYDECDDDSESDGAAELVLA